MSIPTETTGQDFQGEDRGGYLLLLLFGVLLWPGTIVAFIERSLLTRRHQRMSLIALYAAAFDVLLLIIWTIVGAGGKFTAAVKHLSSWQQMLPAYFIFAMAVGTIVGLIFVFIEIKGLKSSPHRLEQEGAWSYHFRYKRTPWEARRRRKEIESLRRGELVDGEKVPLGITEDGRDNIAYRYYSEASTHTLITGASGAGKSIFSMMPMIRGDIENQIPTFIIDFKRDPEFASKVAAWAKEFGGDFYHFVNGREEDYDIANSHRRQCYYDPFAGSTPTSMADMLLGMREYDGASAVYKANMQQYLQVVVQAIFAGKREALQLHPEVVDTYSSMVDTGNLIDFNNSGLFTIASAIKPGAYTELIKVSQGEDFYQEVSELGDMLSDKRSGETHAAEELRGQVRTITASEYGSWLKKVPQGDEDRLINLLQLSRKPGAVVMFSLNSDSEPEFAKFMGSLILSDITNVSAQRRNAQDSNSVSIYVDEFQILPPSSVSGLLEKSRASKIAVTLALQSFDQIVAAAPNSGESYLLSVLDTCSNFITHNGATQDSAERLAKILGKHWETVYRVSNRNKSFFMSFNWANKREAVVQQGQEEKWRFEPKEFMSLSSPTKLNGYQSTAILINKSCADPNYATNEGAVARKILLVPPMEVLKTYYNPDKARGEYVPASHKISSVSIVANDGAATEVGATPAAPSFQPKVRVTIEDTSKPQLPDPSSSISYMEDDDGTFSFERVEDDDSSPAPPPATRAGGLPTFRPEVRNEEDMPEDRLESMLTPKTFEPPREADPAPPKKITLPKL